MIDYENMDDLLDVDDETKLKIVKREINKIDCLNDLLLNALQYNRLAEQSHAYIYASKLIGNATWNIRKMFPY